MKNYSVALVLIVGLVGGCKESKQFEKIATAPGPNTMFTNNGSVVARTEPPPGASIYCDEVAGVFMPVLSNKYAPVFNPVYSNKQDAINRAWALWGNPAASPNIQKDSESYNWSDCK